MAKPERNLSKTALGNKLFSWFFLFQRKEIFSCWRLKNLQIEIGDGSQDMIKNIGLNMLKIHKAPLFAKTVYLNRQSLVCGIEIPDQEEKIFVNCSVFI